MASINDNLYTTYQLDEVFGATSLSQIEFFNELAKLMRRLPPAVLTNRMALNLEIKQMIGNINHNKLMRSVDKIVDNVVKFEWDLTNDRLIRAYRQGIIGKLPTQDDYFIQISRATIVNRALDVQNRSIQIKANRAVNGMASYVRGVTSGKVSVGEAVDNVLKEIASTPWTVPVRQASGRIVQWNADALITRDVRNDIKEIARVQTNKALKDTRINLVEVSFHATSRPDHAEWQGEVFWLYTPDPKYRPFAVCGEGEPDGFGGVNCRHRKAPFIEGIDDQPQHRDNDDAGYQALQELRHKEMRAKKLTQRETMLGIAGELTMKSLKEPRMHDWRLGHLPKQNG